MLFSRGNVTGVAEGVKWGLVVACASGLPVLWYNGFHGTAPVWILAVDTAHQLIGHAVVGAILAGWR